MKFWFIKNYMSPQMRAFVPHMAAHYDFDYEFVTYKWPSWLHKQARSIPQKMNNEDGLPYVQLE